MDTLRFRQNGFSLVELMLAMALSLFMLGGLFLSVIGELKSYESVRATEQLASKTQMSVKSLRMYIMQAGFRDLDNLMLDREFAAETGDWTWALQQRLQGLNAPDSSALSTLSALSSAQPTSDIIAVRFIGMTTASSSTTSSSSSDVIDCNGNAVVTNDEYEISLYVSDANELICQDINGAIVLDENIEHMRLMYGIDDDSTYKYYDADDVTDWSAVNRVKIALLLAQEVTANYQTNNNSYQLFDRTISAANDTNYRLVTTETVLIRN